MPSCLGYDDPGSYGTYVSYDSDEPVMTAEKGAQRVLFNTPVGGTNGMALLTRSRKMKGISLEDSRADRQTLTVSLRPTFQGVSPLLIAISMWLLSSSIESALPCFAGSTCWSTESQCPGNVQRMAVWRRARSLRAGNGVCCWTRLPRS